MKQIFIALTGFLLSTAAIAQQPAKPTAVKPATTATATKPATATNATYSPPTNVVGNYKVI